MRESIELFGDSEEPTIIMLDHIAAFQRMGEGTRVWISGVIFQLQRTPFETVYRGVTGKEPGAHLKTAAAPDSTPGQANAETGGEDEPSPQAE